jgi:hypothetical protein
VDQEIEQVDLLLSAEDGGDEGHDHAEGGEGAGHCLAVGEYGVEDSVTVRLLALQSRLMFIIISQMNNPKMMSSGGER